MMSQDGKENQQRERRGRSSGITITNGCFAFFPDWGRVKPWYRHPSVLVGSFIPEPQHHLLKQHNAFFFFFFKSNQHEKNGTFVIRCGYMDRK